MQDPAVDSVNAYVGGGNGYSKAFMQVPLKPLAERGISSDEVIDRLRPKLDPIPGATRVSAIRSRTCASADAAAPRNINTRCKATTCTI